MTQKRDLGKIFWTVVIILLLIFAAGYYLYFLKEDIIGSTIAEPLIIFMAADKACPTPYFEIAQFLPEQDNTFRPNQEGAFDHTQQEITGMVKVCAINDQIKLAVAENDCSSSGTSIPVGCQTPNSFSLGPFKMQQGTCTGSATAVIENGINDIELKRGTLEFCSTKETGVELIKGDSACTPILSAPTLAYSHDVDGDGKDSVILWSGNKYTIKNQGQKWTPLRTINDLSVDFTPNVGYSYDLDGDGEDWVALWQGSKVYFYKDGAWQLLNPQKDADGNVINPDFGYSFSRDGTGKDKVVVWDGDKFYQNSGSGWSSPSTLNAQLPGGDVEIIINPVVGYAHDIDGDGRDTIILWNAQGYAYHLAPGASAWVRSAEPLTDSQRNVLSDLNLGYSHDMDGDGKDEVTVWKGNQAFNWIKGRGFGYQNEEDCTADYTFAGAFYPHEASCRYDNVNPSAELTNDQSFYKGYVKVCAEKTSEISSGPFDCNDGGDVSAFCCTNENYKYLNYALDPASNGACCEPNDNIDSIDEVSNGQCCFAGNLMDSNEVGTFSAPIADILDKILCYNGQLYNCVDSVTADTTGVLTNVGSNTQISDYNCINSKWVEVSQGQTCDENDDCRPKYEYCDLNTNTCANCQVADICAPGTTPIYDIDTGCPIDDSCCGDDSCEGIENGDNCALDCPACALDDAYWEEDNISEGNELDLTVETNGGCNGLEFDFTILETDDDGDDSATADVTQPDNVDARQDYAVTQWEAELGEDEPTYYIFNASTVSNLDRSIVSNVLAVYESGCEDWECTQWSTCVNSIRTRICTDANECGTNLTKPRENETCQPGTGTCYDNTKNQNELGIDCGGLCSYGFETDCNNGRDDDFDCQIDCLDPDCSTDPDCKGGAGPGTGTSAVCLNGICESGEIVTCPADCKPTKDTKSKFPWLLLLIILLIIILIVVGFLLYKKYGGKKKAKPQLFANPKDLDKLKKYIKYQLDHQVPEQNIKSVLKSKKWTDKQIDFAFEEVKKSVKKA